ncbi:MAG: Gfo/Idh/MocA family oxidoreductase [Armatimonadetes bacterium]|nr:Gfo/Idh/MocA family oxidoreductase [Armatimonadota bacterium]
MADSVRVGIAGYGLAGRYFHAPFIRLCEGLEVGAIFTRSQERQAQARADFPQARVYGTYEEMLEDEEIGLVVLATPHDVHEPMAIAALEAGKHVVTDKIMAPDAEAAQRMLDAARRAGRVLSVYQNRRWDSDFLTARKAVEDGLLGEVWEVEVYLDAFRKPGPGWRWERARGGGRFRDWGAHLFDQAMVFAGAQSAEGVEVWADWQYRYPEVDVETEVVTHLRFPSGLRYTIHISVQQRIERWDRWVVGSDGTLLLKGIDPQESFLRGETIQVVAGTERAKLPRENVELVSEAEGAAEPLEIVPGDWMAYWRNIADVLLHGAELIVKPEQVVEAIKLIDRAAAYDPRGG